MKISAVIPAYNRLPYVCRAVESILAQSVPVDEIIVVDDGSSDGTAETVGEKFGSGVKVITQQNGGVSAARRRGVLEAQGEWVAFLDSDDLWVPDRTAAFLKAAAALPTKVAWIFGDTRFVTDTGEGSTVFTEHGLRIEQSPRVYEKPLSELDWDPRRARVCVLQSSFIRRAALLEFSCFSEGFRHAEDFLASMQIASRYPFAGISQVVTKLFRTSDLNESSLEQSMPSSGDRYEAIMKGYAIAAQSTGERKWAELHAKAVRALCKWRAQQGQPIRRLAREQFKFGLSAPSVAFFGAAMLGSSVFQAGFAAKRKLKAVAGRS